MVLPEQLGCIGSSIAQQNFLSTGVVIQKFGHVIHAIVDYEPCWWLRFVVSHLRCCNCLRHCSIISKMKDQTLLFSLFVNRKTLVVLSASCFFFFGPRGCGKTKKKKISWIWLVEGPGLSDRCVKLQFPRNKAYISDKHMHTHASDKLCIATNI